MQSIAWKDSYSKWHYPVELDVITHSLESIVCIVTHPASLQSTLDYALVLANDGGLSLSCNASEIPLFGEKALPILFSFTFAGKRDW